MLARHKRYIWGVGILVLVVISFQLILAQYLKFRESRKQYLSEFPLGVDPVREKIVEDERVYSYFPKDSEALALSSYKRLEEIFLLALAAIAEFLDDRNLALAGREKVVRVTAGMRREEVAKAFGRALGWKEAQNQEFLKTGADGLPYFDGTFMPGVYVISKGDTPKEVQERVNKRFRNEVASRYSTSTAEVIPIELALTIASLIERETIGTDDMRIISGIIWNRIFADMKLQLDATLQYAKASQKKGTLWWPPVRTQDKYIKSPYNTYLHDGLPPTPIANPGVAAIVAALNPMETECFFYFHDDDGDFYCARTYKEHVALLKKHYGRGR